MSLISLLMQHPVAWWVMSGDPVIAHSSGIYCYDMFYQKGKTPFLAWCEQRGSKRNADGFRNAGGTGGSCLSSLSTVFCLTSRPVIKQLQEENCPRESGHPVPDREEWDE